jgi:hypothetical protein
MPAYPAESDAQPPTPATLVEVFQETFGVAGVPVKPVGPVTVTTLPARCGAAVSLALAAPVAGADNFPKQLIDADSRRKRVVLICDVDWIYARQGSDKHGAPWPKSVPLVLEHCDAVYAMAQSSAGTLSAIVESWAD